MRHLVVENQVAAAAAVVLGSSLSESSAVCHGMEQLVVMDSAG